MKVNKPIFFLIAIITLFTAIYFLNKPNSKPLIFEEIELNEEENLRGGVSSTWVLVSNYEDHAAKNASIDSFVCATLHFKKLEYDTLIREFQFMFFQKTKNIEPVSLKGLSGNEMISRLDKSVIAKYDFYSSGKVHVWLFNNGKLWRILHDFSCM